MNKDDSYEKIASLLIDLKSALKDINELRNEPILLKIQSNNILTVILAIKTENLTEFDGLDGSISFDDFLNDTSLIKTKLGNYGLDPQVADVYLSSKIKIIEVSNESYIEEIKNYIYPYKLNLIGYYLFSLIRKVNKKEKRTLYVYIYPSI